MPKETSRLLDAWRQAERAAGAARLAAEHAQEAVDAAERSAEAARLAAQDAGLSLEIADAAATGAKQAFHERESEIISEDGQLAQEEPRGVPEAG